MEITLAKIEEAGCQALARFAREAYIEAFGHTFEPQELAAHLDRQLSDAALQAAFDNDTFIGAFDHRDVVGFVQFGPTRFDGSEVTAGDQQLRRLYVASAFQRKGLGTRLMNAALADERLVMSRAIYLDVWERNHGARALYERFGFRTVRKKLFRFPSGALGEADLIVLRRP